MSSSSTTSHHQKSTKIMDQRMTIVTLGVKDLSAATTWYQDTLGWEILAASSNDNITFFQLGGGMLLSLYPLPKLVEDVVSSLKDTSTADTSTEDVVSKFRGFTMAYNARSEQDVNDIFEALKKKSVTIVKEPQKVFWGGYSGYISDLDNNMWEIAYNPFLKLDDKGNAV